MKTATRRHTGNPAAVAPQKARKLKAVLPPVWHHIVSREATRVRLQCSTRLEVSELSGRMYMVQDGMPLPKDVVAAVRGHASERQMETRAEVNFQYRCTLAKMLVDAGAWKTAAAGRRSLPGGSFQGLIGKELP